MQKEHIQKSYSIYWLVYRTQKWTLRQEDEKEMYFKSSSRRQCKWVSWWLNRCYSGDSQCHWLRLWWRL